MASNIPGIRFVKCPKCHKVLTEIAQVPVYRCGGCGTVLRAKNHVAAVGEVTSSGSLGNNSLNLSESNSLNKESLSLAVDAAVERVVSSDLAISNSSTSNDPHPMAERSDHAEEGIKGRSEINTEAERQPEERNQVEQDHFLDEQSEKSMNPSPQDCDSSRSSDKVEQSSVMDMKFAVGSSHSYDGSVSSPDKSQGNRLPPKYLLLSKRTFRRRKVSDSVDSVEKEAKIQGQNLPEKSSDERGVSAIRGRVDSNREELPSGPCIPAMERDKTFGSEDFHSVQNWIGSETDEGASKSLSMDMFLHSQIDKKSTKPDCLEPDHMKILKKVDELRDELSGFLTRTAEGKKVPSPFKHQLSGQPPYYCRGKPPLYPRKDKAEDRVVEKSHNKEKKIQIKYCRPVSGGAPFVICYKCWRLLQLPADFLVTRKRLHKLKCGACSELLVFSFRPRDRTAPMTPIEVQHPPSEVDNNNDRTGWDPLSCSGDYRISPEAERVLHVSRNSSYSIEGRDGQQALHRLMGYPSARQLLFRPRSSDGYESTEPSTPQFNRPLEEDMRYGLNGPGIFTPNSMEIQEEDELQQRLRNRRKALALQGFLKKGVRELSHGLESMKLKINSNG